MKRKVKLALLGVVLQGGMQAAAQDVVAVPAPGAAQRTQSAPPPVKKAKPARGKKSKTANSRGDQSATGLKTEGQNPTSANPPDPVPETQPATTEQSIQVKGVRG